jgi:hypothetical protein
MGRIHKIGEFVAEEFVKALPGIIFFVIGFNLIVFSTNLLLSEYKFGGFVVATMAAIVVGKAVQVAETMAFFSCFESAPLIRPVLFKTCVFTLFVFIARLMEAYIHYMINEGRLIGIFFFLYEQLSSVGMLSARHLPGWHRFVFVQLWTFVLLLAYTTGAELNRLLGYGILTKLFFTRWMPANQEKGARPVCLVTQRSETSQKQR